MRVLHTADWHLGAAIDGASLLEEQSLFLGWLLEVIVEQEVDALLVCGDVFDLANPSSEAQGLYFRFLAGLSALGRRCVAVVTGGNHDSASRLEAPRELLGALSVHVVGAVPPEGERGRMLVPLVGGDGEVEVVVAAVPYVHEYRLGVSAVGLGVDALRRRVVEAFSGLYGGLAAEARERFGDVPLVACGHLTVAGEAREEQHEAADSPRAVHQVGSIDALPPSIFGDGWSYIALGHIHRGYAVGGPNCRYSGTPVAVSTREGETPRRVRIVELGPGGVTGQRAIEVPRWRSVRAFVGSEAEVMEASSRAVWEGELEPIVRFVVQVESADATLDERIRRHVATLNGNNPPRVVAVQQTRIRSALAESVEVSPSLQELTPEQVFRRLYASRSGGGEPSEELMIAFRSLAEEEVVE